jgi:hypothetical protein
MPQAVTKYDRVSQGVNASRAQDRPTRRAAADSKAAHDDEEDSENDDVAVVQYEKPKSSLSSKTAHTSGKNPFDDEKSRKPRPSGQSTAKPANNNNRMPARNDLQDPRRAAMEKKKQLAREKELHNNNNNNNNKRHAAAEYGRKLAEAGHRRTSQHTSDARAR